MSAPFENGQRPSDEFGQALDPSDYKQTRRIRSVIDAQEDVREIHLTVTDRRLDGLGDQRQARLAMYEAVRQYIFVSEPVIRRDHVAEQWFWFGWYPTESGEPPIATEYDEQHGVTVPVANDDGEPEQIALEPDEQMVDPDTGEPIPRDEWTRPRLLATREGEALYPTLTNIVGREPVDRPEDAIPLMGLAGFWDLDLPMTFTESKQVRHQLKIWEEQREVERYHVSIETSLRAARLLNRFWDPILGLEQDSGLPRQREANFATGERGYVERGDPF